MSSRFSQEPEQAQSPAPDASQNQFEAFFRNAFNLKKHVEEKKTEEKVVTPETLSLMSNRVMSDGENLYNT